MGSHLTHCLDGDKHCHSGCFWSDIAYKPPPLAVDAQFTPSAEKQDESAPGREPIC
jgi:hypothetical protein